MEHNINAQAELRPVLNNENSTHGDIVCGLAAKIQAVSPVLLSGIYVSLANAWTERTAAQRGPHRPSESGEDTTPASTEQRKAELRSSFHRISTDYRAATGLDLSDEEREAIHASLSIVHGLSSTPKALTPPSCNTGGTQVFPHAVIPSNPAPQGQKTIIDTISWTIPDQSHEGTLPASIHLTGIKQKGVKSILATVLDAFPKGCEWTAVADGKQGYPYQTQLVSGSLVLGWLAFGAAHGKHWLYIGGTGLRHRREHGFADDSLAGFTDLPGARLGRVDIALDVYDHATFSVDSSIAALASGGYQLTRSPCRPHDEIFQSSTKSDDYAFARTHYIGSRKGKKRLRVYDKGLQLLGSLTPEELFAYTSKGVIRADPTPEGKRLEEWTRVELIYKHDKQRPLDNKLILERDDSFAGGYPVLAQLLGVADGIRPSYIPKDEDCELAKLIEAGKASYGGLIYFLRNERGYDDARIIGELIGTKSAARLEIDKERTDI